MTQNLCKSFLLESLQGIHDFRVDQFKLALYAGNTLDPDVVTAYTAAGEVSGTGYSAGGALLTVATGYPKLSTTTGVRKSLLTFNNLGPIAGNGFSYRLGLIYNFSKANRGVAVVDFGSLQVVTASYGVSWPTPDDSNCLIRFGA